MKRKLGFPAAWLGLLAVALAAVAVVAIPVWLIQPFAPQTKRGVEISFLLRSWSPILTILFTLSAVVLSVYLWRNTKRWYGKAPLVIPLVVVVIFTWFARQNHFEWMFNPLSQTNFASVNETDFVEDSDMVLAVNINGDAVAFPVRQMAYHHVAQDVVGGTPITATY